MRVVAISTEAETRQRYEAAKAQGYVTFIYEHADPAQVLTDESFMYVRSDDELVEKLALVRADPLVADQLRRA